MFEHENQNELLRKRIKKEASEKGMDFLYAKLKKIDSIAVEKINKNDTYRIMRALEIYETTGKSISSYHRKHQFSDKRFIAYKIGLQADRKIIYDRINRRVDNMVKKGFIEEVKKLLEKGLSPESKSMQSIGYRHIIDFLTNKLSFEEAIYIMKRDTRRYAKRQITWFKADKDINWVNPNNILSLKNEIYKFLYNES